MGRNKTSAIPKKSVKSVIAGSLIGSIVCLLLLLVISALFVKSGILPFELIGTVTTVVSCISVFIGAYSAGTISKSNGLLIGGTVGFLLFIICVAVGLILASKTNSADTLTKGAAMITSGCIAGILSVNKKSRRKV